MTPKTRGRADFPLSLKRRLADRVNSRCSRCFAATSGPQTDTGNAVNIGVAAHITAASADGPRFDPTLSHQQRQSIENGIWLCQTCGKLVDSDIARFTVVTLRQLKADAEQQARDSIGIGNAAANLATSTQLFGIPNTRRRNPFFRWKPTVRAALTQLAEGDYFVLHGLGGVGKTEHAVQYAYEFRTAYEVVLWASGAEVQALRNSLAEFATLPELGIELSPLATVRTKLQKVDRWFTTTTKRWLLVIDNVDAVEVKAFLEGALPAAHTGHILITARLTGWTKAFKRLAVDNWDVSESADFLRARIRTAPTASPPTSEEIYSLGEALGRLPLALEQAAAYIEATQVTVADYVKLLTKRGFTAASMPGQDSTTVDATWDLTLSRLSKPAGDTLRICAHFGPEPIPREALRNLREVLFDTYEAGPFGRSSQDCSEVADLALGELASFSLISLSPTDFSIHPLLQAVVRETTPVLPWHFSAWRRMYGYPPRAAWAKALWPLRASRLLLDAQQNTWDNPASDTGIAKMRPYEPHLAAVVSHLPPHVQNFVPSIQVRSLLELYRDRSSSYQAGIDALRRKLEGNAAALDSLREETDWFVQSLEDLYERASHGERGWNLQFELRQGLRPPEKSPKWTVYRVLEDIAEAIVESGEIELGRRIFRLYWNHVTNDPSQASSDRGRVRLSEGLALWNRGRRETAISLFAEGLLLFEDADDLKRGDVLQALCLYALEAPDSSDAWLRQLMHKVLPYAFRYGDIGYPAALAIIATYAERLIANGEEEKGLAILQSALRRFMRPKNKSSFYYRVPLLQARARLLAKRGSLIPAARTFAYTAKYRLRFWTFSRVYSAPANWEAGDLFLRARKIEAAKQHLRAAKDLLLGSWEDKPDFAETYAMLTADGLAKAGCRDEARLLYRRVLTSCEGRPDQEPLRLQAIRHSILEFETKCLEEDRELGRSEIRHISDPNAFPSS